MIQIYLLSIVYMLISALVLLLDDYRQKLSFLLRFRAMLEENNKALNVYFVIGIAISMLMLFLPIAPGPMILGDLLPASWLLFLSFYFRVIYSEKHKAKYRFHFDGNGKKRTILGKITLIVLFIHFLLPSFVLI